MQFIRTLFERRVALYGLVCALFTGAVIYSQSAAALDFDSDGVDDVLAVTIGDDEQLSWAYLSSSSSFQNATPIPGAADFGAAGDNLVVGYFTDPQTLSIGYTTESDGNVIWRIMTNSQVQEFEFGSDGDLAVVAGADVTGDGITDPTRITSIGRVISRPSAFVADNGNISANLPRRGARRANRFYFMNPDGARDRVGFIRNLPRRANRVGGGYVDVQSGNYQRLVFPQAVPGVVRQAMSITKPDGTDALLIVTRRSNSRHLAFIFDPMNSYRRVYRGRIARSEVVVGNFNPQVAGDEIGFKNPRGQFVTLSPFGEDRSRTVHGATSAILADMHNVNGEGDRVNQTPPGGGGAQPTPPPTGGTQCGAPPSGGGVWKPRADHFPSPVFIERPGRQAAWCRFERPDGSVYMNYTFTGFANPIGGVGRPHWRPANTGVSCGSYPSNGRMRCANACYSIPSPCARYDRG